MKGENKPKLLRRKRLFFFFPVGKKSSYFILFFPHFEFRKESRATPSGWPAAAAVARGEDL
jgi:hypothetical protein